MAYFNDKELNQIKDNVNENDDSRLFELKRIQNEYQTEWMIIEKTFDMYIDALKEFPHYARVVGLEPVEYRLETSLISGKRNLFLIGPRYTVNSDAYRDFNLAVSNDFELYSTQESTNRSSQKVERVCHPVSMKELKESLKKQSEYYCKDKYAADFNSLYQLMKSFSYCYTYKDLFDCGKGIGFHWDLQRNECEIEQRIKEYFEVILRNGNPAKALYPPH